MNHASGSFLRRLVPASLLLVALPGCGILATRTEHEEALTRITAAERAAEQARQEAAALRAELEATRGRVDTSLKANADASSSLMGEQAKAQQLNGRLEEARHEIDELRKELAATRRETDTKLDELKRSAEAQAQKPAPVTIPGDKGSHFASIQTAYGQKDWNLARTLGREYLTRYPDDEKADDVLFLTGDANLKEGRPASALGDFNRILKQYPKSNTLGATLYAMGEAYLLLHDCANAKLAFSACESRFPKEKLGAEAKAKMAQIAKPAPGTCER